MNTQANILILALKYVSAQALFLLLSSDFQPDLLILYFCFVIVVFLCVVFSTCFIGDMTDIQKVIDAEYVQLEMFGGKYIPMKK